MTKDLTWDLDILYKGFDDPKYAKDTKHLNEVCDKLQKLAEGFDPKKPLEEVTNYLKLEEEFMAVFSELRTYAGLRTSTNVNDMEAMGEMGKMMLTVQKTVPASVAFSKYLQNVDINALCKESEFLNQYKFVLENEKEDASHMLSDKEEVLASKLSMVGSDAWSDLQSKLTSNLLIKVEGFDEEMPLSAVRGLAYDNDPKVRKAAYEAELKAYKGVEDAVAMSLNNIKREVNILVPLRGYKDALDKTLKQSHLKEETLNAMIEAIKEERPKFEHYYKLKAKALGYDYDKGLPFYEIFAPMGHLTKTFTFDEAKDEVLSVYKTFSDSLYNMGYEAFNNRWIDVLPHAGKVGGAFCSGCGTHDQSRVLTNFTGSLSDISTLAHELGHAYHGHVCHQNAPLNRHYPMPLAETASIFCETLMSKKLINEITDPMEKLTVVENSIQGDAQCVIDILSRYLFETDVLKTPISKPLSAKDMCDMMLNAQDNSYGKGLDHDFRHPYMWLCKSHYYSAGLNFYNWPYAFGLLYGKGLYKVYLKDKEAFVKNYDQMLKNTGMMSVEDVAKGMGIDVTKKAFWKESLEFIEEDIDLFEKLLKKTKLIK